MSRRPTGRSAWARTSTAATTCCATSCCCSIAARARDSSTRGTLVPRPRRPGARQAPAEPATVAQLREEAHLAFSPVAEIRRRDLPRGAPDAGLLRLGAPQLRRPRAARGLAELRAVAAPRADRRARLVAADRGEGHRIRLQDPGEHGPQAPRPDRLRAPLLGALRARHAPARTCVRARQITVHSPVMFLAREREIAEEAWPGRHPRHPQPRPAAHRRHPDRGRGAALHRHPVVRAGAAAEGTRRPIRSKAKHLGKALTHLAEEGAAQIFRTRVGGEWIVGVAGSLQFDVLADRIRTEYELPVAFQPTSLFTARWLEADEDARAQALPRLPGGGDRRRRARPAGLPGGKRLPPQGRPGRLAENPLPQDPRTGGLTPVPCRLPGGPSRNIFGSAA